MAKIEGHDWNPRKLSTFSTFGAVRLPQESKYTMPNNDPVYANVSNRILENGHAKPKEKIINDHPKYHKEEDCNVSHNKYNKCNGHVTPVTLPRTKLVTESASPINQSTVNGTACSTHSNEHPIYQNTHMSSLSNGNKSDLLPFHPVQKKGANRGTKVPPPILPRHAYSKSLIGEENTAVTPYPSHSRSMSGDHFGKIFQLVFKDGVGDISLFLGPVDRRFGFSVIGGCDEISPPRIDEIAKGSPADKADLEVGDEILEVNGKSLENATHTEVISHIHNCIRSRTICLRVKRRTGNKIAADLAASSNVQDAFVIAVEQRARERLERLSALKKIKPVDMTKLSSQLSEPSRPPLSSAASEASGSEDVNGVLEASPIYVTTVPNLTSSSAPVQRSSLKSRSSTPGLISSSSPHHHLKSPSSTAYKQGTSGVSLKESSEVSVGSRATSSTSRSKRAHHSQEVKTPSSFSLEGEVDGGNKSGDELELTHDLDYSDPLRFCPSASEGEEEEDISESGDSNPASPEKVYDLSVLHHPRLPHHQKPRKEVLLDSKVHHIESSSAGRPKSPLETSLSLESKGSASSRKSGGSGSSSGDGRSKPPCSRRSSGFPDNKEYRDSGIIESSNNMISMVEFDPADKEMAVDVPDTFVGRTKTPPRYPPPKLHHQTTLTSATSAQSVPYNNNNNYNSSYSSKSSSSKQGASLSSGSTTPVNGSLSKPTLPSNFAPEKDVFNHNQSLSQEEALRLKCYEGELKNRREREAEMAELQRSSIRGSQKLQALATYPSGSPLQPQPTGATNLAYEETDHSSTKESSPNISELIQSLERIQNVLRSNGHQISEDMTVVAHLLSNPDFQKVLAVHNKVQEIWCLQRPPSPTSASSQQLVKQCIEVLKRSTSPDTLELVQLLNKFTVEGLLYAHDRISSSEPEFELPNGVEYSLDAPATVTPPANGCPSALPATLSSNNVQIVRIDKTSDPLGATIRNEGESVIVGRIVRGGAAEKSGRLHEGDEILEVNGIDVRGKSVNDVCDMLTGMTGTLTFMIVPSSQLSHPSSPRSFQAMHIKAFFDYDPEEDLYIPCRELGMSFQKGDILHVMNQEDPNWWQAYRDGEEDHSLAGLIPSRPFQQQREAMRQTVVGDEVSNRERSSKKGKLLCAKKHHKKKRKEMLCLNFNEGVDSEEILTYEVVALYFPRANRKRPIVLIGPPNIGRHELRQKLMEDTEKFAAAIPHTSRPKRDHELDGQDYHFISRAQFEAGIVARKFVEHGEFEKAYYGTSLDAIRAVVNSGKVCVLNLHTVSLRMLKNSDLMPYFVLIAPPSLEKLRQKKQKLGEPFKEEELKDTIQKAREMEDEFGHYFDLVLINQDLERTYQQLIHEINVLEREPQWVPAMWLANT